MANFTINSSNGIFAGTALADVFLFDPANLGGQPLVNFTGIINGAGGKDTLRFQSSFFGIPSPDGFVTGFNFTGATLTGIRQLDFRSTIGQVFQVAVREGQLATGTKLIGSKGVDELIIRTTGAGDHFMPELTFGNWGANVGQLSDFVALIGEGNLFARDNFGSVQSLVSLSSGATLTGSNGTDFLFAVRGSNGGRLLANGGDDALQLGGSPSLSTYTNMVIDGGEGVDQLKIIGQVYLADSAIDGIEKLRLEPVDPNQPTQPFASLTVATSETVITPEIELSGTGALTLRLTGDGESGVLFDGSAITFAPDANIIMSVEGSDKNDTIIGTFMADFLRGDDGNDVLKGGAGKDLLEGGYGDDVIEGGDGNDTATYFDLGPNNTGPLPFGFVNGVYVDLTKAGPQDTHAAGFDTLTGIENLTGSNFNDVLVGDTGPNTLFGGNGLDVLVGGAGRDTLIGGQGPDIFFYTAASDSTVAYVGRDTIVDFTRSQDKINLQALGESLFLGGSKFTESAGEIIQQTSANGTVVKVDLDGDGVGDFGLLVQFSGPLVASDFIL
jgi:Ca2+-binding RTX toxin-like protein